MKIFVLGSTGMLGNYVYKYLKEKFLCVVNLDKPKIDAKEQIYVDLMNFLYEQNVKKDDVIINCIGVIKQKTNVSNLEFVTVNALFPLMLSKLCQQMNIRLIHVTTDCVFDGKLGNYIESSPHNATDVYGKSKSLGEPDNCTVIRTSIIGEELKNKMSLLEWVKSNRNKEVNGFTNHIWNGITCLQFAKVCEKIISDNLFWKGVRHIFSPTWVNKAQLVEMISGVYELGVMVKHTNTPEKCDRTLSSNFDECKKLQIPSLREQLEEQKEFFKWMQ